MKTINRIFVVLTLMLLLNTSFVSAQDNQRAQYITVTTLHRNLDNNDPNWKDVEKEYFQKVTMKNEYILGSGFYLHRWTPDNTEIKYVQVYANWDAIEKAAARSAELEKEARPDEKTREAFLKKQRSFYTANHSDEIYATMANAKIPSTKMTEDKILYLQTQHFAFPENGSAEEFNALHKEYVDNVIKKNNSILGYYPNRHAWGADRTEFVQAFLVNSVNDLENLSDTNNALFEAHWKDEASRKAFGEKMRKYFTGKHGDAIFTAIADLDK